MEKTWLDFVKDERYTGMTLVYDVITKDNSQVIGKIRYHSETWRYVFFPEPNLPLGRTALREIADFIQKLMDERAAHRTMQKQLEKLTIKPTDLF